MPIFMDRHDVSEEVTAENVAQLHQADLKIQDQYNCKGLTYWFDDVRKTAFCLIEAPNKESLTKMHNDAHGEVPHRIIEVDPAIVESFLGRIEDPKKSQKTELNIINDPAFRTLVVFRNEFPDNEELLSLTTKLDGRMVSNNLISFTSVTKAVEFSVSLLERFTQSSTSFGIGVSSGIPVSEKKEIFEDTITLSHRLSEFGINEILISSEVFDLFMSENKNQFPYKNQTRVIKQSEEKFLTELMDFVEHNWQNTELQVEDFNDKLGYSKSKFYRVLKSLTGKSANTFLKDYRLAKAMIALKTTDQSVSEIAYNSGFSSPSYFSKCFQKKYDSLPSSYQRAKY